MTDGNKITERDDEMTNYTVRDDGKITTDEFEQSKKTINKVHKKTKNKYNLEKGMMTFGQIGGSLVFLALGIGLLHQAATRTDLDPGFKKQLAYFGGACIIGAAINFGMVANFKKKPHGEMKLWQQDKEIFKKANDHMKQIEENKTFLKTPPFVKKVLQNSYLTKDKGNHLS